MAECTLKMVDENGYVQWFKYDKMDHLWSKFFIEQFDKIEYE